MRRWWKQIPGLLNSIRALRHRRALLVWSLSVAGLSFFLLWRFVPRPPEPLAVLRSALIEKEGRLFLTGAARPFTGSMIERYPDATLRSESAIANGLLHGLSQGWYTNGQLEIKEQFKAGKSHGLRTRWYPSGAKLSEASIREGQLHGPFRRWHENGTVAEQVQMQRGKPDGVAWSFYPSGFAKGRAKLEQGRVVNQVFWRDGEQKRP
jgi:antitoxin component YwqK of YwqJK toxin-antitoxin module